MPKTQQADYEIHEDQLIKTPVRQYNMDVRQKSIGSGTLWWVVTSKDPAQPSLGDLDLSDIT